MGISNPRLSVPRDPPVWCEAETGSAANITPELPAEQEKALSKHGRRRAVINPRPRMVGRSGRLGAATRVVPQRFIFRLCLLGETKAIFLTGENQLPTRTVGRIAKPVWASAPTDGLQEVREKNPPVTASPCPPPLGKGAWGTGIATKAFFKKGEKPSWSFALF